MLSGVFYLIVIAVLGVTGWLLFKKGIAQREQQCLPIAPQKLYGKQSVATQETVASSPYADELIILRVAAGSTRVYHGYELQQTFLTLGLKTAEDRLFHYYANNEAAKPLFSVAAATREGTFNLEQLGGFECPALLLFMKLKPKKRLMADFDLMLDLARQLVEELGGEIYDEYLQPITPEVLKRLRERICRLDRTANLYSADLLDSLEN